MAAIGDREPRAALPDQCRMVLREKRQQEHVASQLSPLSLKQALADLQDVGIINAWKIDDGDLVHISRDPSDSQAKHIRTKKKKKQAWEAYLDKTDPRRASALDAAERRPKDITEI